MSLCGQNTGQNFENDSVLEKEALNEFEKWHATRVNMGGVGSVLAWLPLVAWVTRYRV